MIPVCYRPRDSGSGGGRWLLKFYSRATDDTGNVQPPAPAVVWNQHGLHWNGTAPHPITVLPMSNMP
jgi:hypothetical protein